MAKWNFDQAHTAAAFSARHMMVTTVRGQFQTVTGSIEFDPTNPAASSVEATIEAATLTTGVNDRDNHLRSQDFLDVAQFPYITFKSTRIELDGNSGDNTTVGKITGDLTVHGVTKPVVIKAEYLGQNKNPWGKQVVGFSGKTKINREDFGLTWNVALETGGVLVGKDITIELDVEAVLVEEAVPATANA